MTLGVKPFQYKTLPLSLSYHAGGNKVETIASSVGLGWSVNGIPIITRSVQGLPDEGPGGYFHKYMGKTMEQIAEAPVGEYQNFLLAVKNGEVDTEPDAFFYNINGKSGKFYFNKTLNKFITFPKTNISISFEGNAFVIIDDNGNQYIFNETETTTVSGTSPGEPVTTSWMGTKIINASKIDTITFQYVAERQLSGSVGGEVKYEYLVGSLNSSNLKNNIPLQLFISLINAKVLTGITFRNGSFQFIPESSERQDLIGGFALEKIKLLNSSNKLLRTFEFDYEYLTGSNSGTGCLSTDTYRTNKWMFLKELREKGEGQSKILKHQFFYDKSICPPCRNSASQDYWGYFNGMVYNTTLIPPAFLPGTTNKLEGADRSVKPNYSKFGILTKIEYPTGGQTEFIFENNIANNTNLPINYIKTTVFIAAEGESTDPENNTPLPNLNTYRETFTIDNPPNIILNNSNPNGGAFVSADVGALGVPPGTYGAYLLLKGLSLTNSHIHLVFYESFLSRYLPNGDYELVGVFDQNPPNYQDSYCFISWDKIDISNSVSYVGGLRIKEIKNFAEGTTNPIVKRYKYTMDYDSETSSGDVFGAALLKYEDQISSIAFDPHYINATFFRRMSFSNQSQVTSSGAYIGYKQVFVETDLPESTGVSSYKYRHDTDIIDDQFPYPPNQSMESFRGNLQQLRYFKLNNGNLSLIQDVQFYYLDSIYENEVIFGIKTSLESLSPTIILNVVLPASKSYQLAPTWSSELSKIEVTHDLENPSATVQTETEYEYNNSLGLIDVIRQKGSDNQNFVVKNYYPHNSTLTGVPESARQWFNQKNVKNALLKSEHYQNNALISSKSNNFKNFDGSSLVKLHHIRTLYKDGSIPSLTEIGAYDAFGNVLEVQEEDGPKTVYLWSYNSEYPIAEIKNVDYTAIEAALGKIAIQQFCKTVPSDAAVSSFLSPLKTLFPQALITSYTYEPLVGMTSKTETTGMVSYFKYDEFQRLQYSKDHEGNIVKSYCYDYMGNIVDCFTGN